MNAIATDLEAEAGSAVAVAGRHAQAWWIVANGVGLWLAMLLTFTSLDAGVLGYGRWVPAHLNLQLYGWTSLPLVALLLRVFEVDRSKVAGPWAVAAVHGWSLSLCVGVWYWLSGRTSGKIFLDWTGAALWALAAAQILLWVVLLVAWRELHGGWCVSKRRWSLAGLVFLACVPLSLAYAASPAVYPPVDRSTGGPTGASLLGSALFVVGLMLLLPRVAAASGRGRAGRWTWIFFGVSWLMFGFAESTGGTHRDPLQILAMAFLLPWVWLLPWDWAGFQWPDGSVIWRRASLLWWGLLVVSGFLMYQPGLLDRIKFTQGLVAHSHLAMAGFTTSFCALLLMLLGRRELGGGSSVILWHCASLGMVVSLAYCGWREGADVSWMVEQPAWRSAVLAVRLGCGAVMMAMPVFWFFKRTEP